MQIIRRPFDVARIWPYFLGLFLLVVPAFWPTYLSKGLDSSGYIHFHAFMASLWMILLVVQPLLISRDGYTLHKAVGKMSYFVAPGLILSIILLANYRLRTVDDEALPVQTYVFYLQVSLGLLFAVCYALAIYNRKHTEVHAAFMICTGLTLIDPVFARIIAATSPKLDLYEQWWTFALTDLLFILLIVSTRKNRAARNVFAVMVVVFVVLQIPALLKLTDGPLWQAFAFWYRSIPLT